MGIHGVAQTGQEIQPADPARTAVANTFGLSGSMAEQVTSESFALSHVIKFSQFPFEAAIHCCGGGKLVEFRSDSSA